MKTDRLIRAPGRLVTAIELGSDWVKLVQADRHGRSPVISRVMVRKLDEGDVASGALARAVKALNCGAGDVIACVPRHAVTVRTFELPSADPREVGDMIDLQIAKQTPYSRDEIVFDYRLSEGAREGYTRVMLVIAPSAVMRQRCRILEDLGLNVRLVTVSTDGLVGAIQHRMDAGALGLGGGIAVLDVDASASEVLVLQDGMVLFSRGLAVGAKDVAEDPIAGSERLIQETARALETFRHESPSGRLERLLLSGALRDLDGLDDRLRAILGLPVERFDFATETIPAGRGSTPDDARGREVSLTAVAGAALAPDRLDIDLTPDSILARRAVARRAAAMTVTAVLIVAALVLMSLFVESRLFERQHYLASLNARVKSTTAAADEIESMKHKVALVTGRARGGMVPVTVLAELHTLIGSDISLTSLELEDGRLTLRGVTLGGPEVSSSLVATMGHSLLFHDVKRPRTQSAKDRTEFEIVCETGAKHP